MAEAIKGNSKMTMKAEKLLFIRKIRLIIKRQDGAHHQPVAPPATVALLLHIDFLSRMIFLKKKFLAVKATSTRSTHRMV